MTDSPRLRSAIVSSSVNLVPSMKTAVEVDDNRQPVSEITGVG